VPHADDHTAPERAPYTPAVTHLRRDAPLVVGFDLDMTLIDSRPSVEVALNALAAETGKPIDVDYLVATLGPPLDVVLAPWFEGDALDAACERYRQLHAPFLYLTQPMPGAVAAVAAVRHRDGRVVVVTSKFEPHARTSIQTIGIEPDALVGWRFGAAKGEALREHGAQAYVGDHLADVAAAGAGGVISVSVATGSTSCAALRDAGTDFVLPDLLAFPRWLDAWLDDNLDDWLDERTDNP
jgi:phosphoglycolate phosphatase